MSNTARFRALSHRPRSNSVFWLKFSALAAVVLVDAASSGSPPGTVHRVVAVEASDPRAPRASDGTVVGITLPRASRSTHGAGVAMPGSSVRA